MGPVLVWHKKSKQGKARLFAFSLAMFAAGASVLSLPNGLNPFFWAGIWQIWAIVLVFSLLITAPFTYTVLSAGADWFQGQTVRFGLLKKTATVRIYELTEIKAEYAGVTWWLTLMGSGGGAHLALHEWQSDRRMWDLVYNGILHSVAAGAECNRITQQLLELDQVRELRYPRGPREIDVTKLDDVQVRRLMQDEMVKAAMDAIDFEGGPAEFRQQVPKLTEDQLLNPADPAWFAGEERADDRWTRFYQGG